LKNKIKAGIHPGQAGRKTTQAMAAFGQYTSQLEFSHIKSIKKSAETFIIA